MEDLEEKFRRLAKRGATYRNKDDKDPKKTAKKAELRDAEDNREWSASWLGFLGGSDGCKIILFIIGGFPAFLLLFAVEQKIGFHSSRSSGLYEVLIALAVDAPFVWVFHSLARVYNRRALARVRQWVRSLPFPVANFESMLAEDTTTDFEITVQFEQTPPDAQIVLDAARTVAHYRHDPPVLIGSVLRIPQLLTTRDAMGANIPTYTNVRTRMRMHKIVNKLLLPLHATATIQSISLHTGYRAVRK